MVKYNQGGFPLTGLEGYRYGLRDGHVPEVPTRASDVSSSEHLHGFHFRRHADCGIKFVVLPSNETAYTGDTAVLRTSPVS